MPLFEEQIRATAPFILADYTHRNLVLPAIAATDTPGVIGELSQAMHKEGCLADVLPFYQSALNQELFSSSASECGIAFPHARMKGISRLQFALGRTPEPITWGVKGSLSVQLIFLVAVPASDAITYLHLLSCLGRLGQNTELVSKLKTTTDAGQMYSLLREVCSTRNR